MRSLRYLNTVLTLIAILLTLNLFTMWSVGVGGEAASLSSTAHAQGTANAAQQRQNIVDQLKLVNVNINQLNQTLTSGRVRVSIEAGRGE